MEMQRREGLAVLAIVILGWCVLLLLEPSVFSLLRGSHFNWVPLHSLAISRHGDAETGLVGYACRLLTIDSEGRQSVSFDYFNRYPIVFSLLSQGWLSAFSDGSERMLLVSKHLMNGIFVMTAGLLYGGLRLAGLRIWPSAMGLLTILASPLWLHYRPMFHFDQPGLLGYALAIGAYLAGLRRPLLAGRQPRRVLFLVGILLASLLGRAFIVSFFLLGCALLSLWRRPLRGTLPLLVAGGGLSLTVPLAAAAWAARVEARLNGVPLAEVSVVQSALRRLGLPGALWADGNQSRLQPGEAAAEMVEAIARLLPSPGILLVGAIALGLALVALRSGVLIRPAARGDHDAGAVPGDLLSAVAIASAGWLIAFRNLIVFHEYAVLFLVPLVAIGTAVLLQRFQQGLSGRGVPARWRRSIAAALTALLLASFLDALRLSLLAWTPPPAEGAALSGFYGAVDRFNRTGGGDRAVLFDPQWVENSPYAPCLLLDADLLQGPGAAHRPLLVPPPFPIEPARREGLRDPTRQLMTRGSLKELLP